MDIRRSLILSIGSLTLLTVLSCETGSGNHIDACIESNSNETLRSDNYEDVMYQNVLLAMLEVNLGKVKYYFENRNKANQIVLKAEGPDFCGFLLVEVKDEDDISSKLQNKSGYSGAEVEKFEFTQEGDQAYWFRAGRIID